MNEVSGIRVCRLGVYPLELPTPNAQRLPERGANSEIRNWSMKRPRRGSSAPFSSSRYLAPPKTQDIEIPGTCREHGTVALAMADVKDFGAKKSTLRPS